MVVNGAKVKTVVDKVNGAKVKTVVDKVNGANVGLFSRGLSDVVQKRSVLNQSDSNSPY